MLIYGSVWTNGSANKWRTRKVLHHSTVGAFGFSVSATSIIYTIYISVVVPGYSSADVWVQLLMVDMSFFVVPPP